MKGMVRNIREGWYGNADTLRVGDLRHKAPADNKKLFAESVKAAATNSIHSARAFLAPSGSSPLIPLTKMMRLTFLLMPLCLILQESTKKMVILGTEIEHSENRDFLGVTQAFSGACLII